MLHDWYLMTYYLMDATSCYFMTCCYIVLLHNLLNKEYLHFIMPSLNTKHDTLDFCIKWTNLHVGRGKHADIDMCSCLQWY